MSQILQFPQRSSDNFPTTAEEATNHINQIRKEYCDHVAMDIFESAMQAFVAYGFHVKSDEEFIKDVVFVEEAIKSMIYRYKKLPHQLQEIAEVTISVNDDTKELIVDPSKLENNI